MTEIGATGRAEWRAGWPVVIASFGGTALASMYAYTMGVLIAPIEAEFGWSRAQISSGFFIISLFSVTLSLFMGMLIDRVGPRRIAIIGVLVYGAALALLSQATPNIYLWWSQWALVALGILCVKPTVWVVAVSSLFVASRGLALAVVLSATGFVSFVMPTLTLAILKASDWRVTYVALGVGGAALVLPLVLIFFRSPADGGRAAPAKQVLGSGMSLREGLLSRSFLLLAAGGFVFSLSSVALTLNMVPILTAGKLGVEAAATTAGAIGIAQIVGRLSGGYLLDRFNARIVAAVSVSFPVVTCALLLAFPGDAAAALVAVVFLGLAAGAEMDAIAYLSAKYFGLHNFAALFGAFFGIVTLGFGIGPMLANAVYDRTGTYDPVLWGIMPAALLAAFLFLMIGPYPEAPNAHHSGD